MYLIDKNQKKKVILKFGATRLVGQRDDQTSPDSLSSMIQEWFYLCMASSMNRDVRACVCVYLFAVIVAVLHGCGQKVGKRCCCWH